MQKYNGRSEFTIVTWAVQVINKKPSKPNYSDNWKPLFRRLRLTSPQTLKDVKNTIEKNSVILKRINKGKEDVEKSYDHFMTELLKLGVPSESTDTQAPSDEETTVDP